MSIEEIREICDFIRIYFYIMTSITIITFIIQIITSVIIIKNLPKIKGFSETQKNHLNEMYLQNREIIYKLDRIEQEIKK